MTFKPTPEQEAIIDSFRHPTGDSILCPAYAGCAKTSTMTLAAHACPEPALLGIAFNKKTAEELKPRFPPKAEIKTLNGLGHGAFGRAIGRKLELNDRKIGQLVTKISKDADLELSQDEWLETKQLVSRAMIRGLVPSTFTQATSLIPDHEESWQALGDEIWLEPTESMMLLAKKVLQESIKLSFQGVICFDDQIYMSALFGGKFPQFPLVIVDEAQDLSPLNHLMIRKCSSGRLGVVGDSKQAIYAFRGADHDSLSKMKSLRPSWSELPLTTTFRCPKLIVERQHSHAPGFNAAPSAPLGFFSQWHYNKQAVEQNGEGWNWPMVTAALAAIPVQMHTPNIAILCRNNAPLLKMAFRLIRNGVGVNMLGRDLGKTLVSLSRKIIPDDDANQVQCITLLTEWTENEVAMARAKDDDAKIDSINDRVGCLEAALEAPGVRTARDLRHALGRLFDTPTGALVTLGTGHRSKGLEYDLVIHLDPWRLPSRQARQQAAIGDTRALIQEMNLQYVIETRSKHTLLTADMEAFKVSD